MTPGSEGLTAGRAREKDRDHPGGQREYGRELEMGGPGGSQRESSWVRPGCSSIEKRKQSAEKA